MSIFNLRGGARIGNTAWDAINYTYPFASLVIDSESLTIKTLFKDHVFKRSDIKSITPYCGYFSKGYKVEHLLKESPPFIVFWTFSPQKVAEALESSGYSVLKTNEETHSTCERGVGSKASSIPQTLAYFIFPLLFMILFAHEKYGMERGVADAALSATLFTGFIAVIWTCGYKRFIRGK